MTTTQKKILLASNSARRKEILTNLGISFMVMTNANCEEKTVQTEPFAIVKALAQRKAESVFEMLNAQDKDSLIISADTLVFKDGAPIGKPQDEAHAFEILKALSGTHHHVCTGYTILDAASGKLVNGCEDTLVYFRHLSDDFIRAYIDTGEPMDKAGAYGIQDKGSMMVSRIEGDYFNVVGLPVGRLLWDLKEKFGFHIF